MIFPFVEFELTPPSPSCTPSQIPGTNRSHQLLRLQWDHDDYEYEQIVDDDNGDSSGDSYDNHACDNKLKKVKEEKRSDGL